MNNKLKENSQKPISPKKVSPKEDSLEDILHQVFQTKRIQPFIDFVFKAEDSHIANLPKEAYENLIKLLSQDDAFLKLPPRIIGEFFKAASLYNLKIPQPSEEYIWPNKLKHLPIDYILGILEHKWAPFSKKLVESITLRHIEEMSDSSKVIFLSYFDEEVFLSLLGNKVKSLLSNSLVSKEWTPCISVDDLLKHKS